MNIKPGQIWRHYKYNGGDHFTYEIVGIARESDSEETLILYKPCYEEDTASGDHVQTIQEFLNEVNAMCCARTAKVWNEKVEYNGEKVPRFSLIKDV